MNDFTTTTATADSAGFRHEPYPYVGDQEFLDGALEFIDDATGTAAPQAAAVSFLDRRRAGPQPRKADPGLDPERTEKRIVDRAGAPRPTVTLTPSRRRRPPDPVQNTP